MCGTGVPFAREYGGLLANRSFGGAQVSRTFYARGQTGQQLLLGCYQALERQVAAGTVTMFPRHEMLDLITVDGVARGIVTRDLVTGAVETWLADAVVLATGGYGNVFYLSTNAKGCNVTATYRAYKRGAAFGNPCFTQIHPTCIPVSGEHQSKLTLMSESLRNDGRVWVPKRKGDHRAPGDIPDGERDYYLERKYPSFGNLSPRERFPRRQVCDEDAESGPAAAASGLDFADAIRRLGGQDPGALRDLFRCTSGSGRESLPATDADLPGRPLHHGWALGGLRSDELHPVRFVDGEANSPITGPMARCQRVDAGPGRWVLHPALHHRNYPRHQLTQVDSGHSAVTPPNEVAGAPSG